MIDWLAVAAWNPVRNLVAAKTGLWRLNAWAWNRKARQLEELASDVAGEPALADSAELLRAGALKYRRWAQEARPS